MAFNFNWSPLTADTTFYDRAKNLLTASLNKYPKPPIIVDDVLVNELNLGSVPPDLEILEIGDLAEDRFRGIFKMCYSGDAFLTLRTRVQANPLSTYLSTTPYFTSPQPLAASSGLTIPLQITLSDIRLSAFIILVFSRQKGLTLVFRNDPLESLKVSSTFDSIPFVRDYLQNEIEGQLRTLLMDEVPAIIHRLSLQWVPEYGGRADPEVTKGAEEPTDDEHVTDPLASPPQDAVDSSGRPLDASQIASLTSDSSAESHALFSQKTLLKLAALNDSHKTLSLFTPSMKDVVFRVWAGPTERGERNGFVTPRTSSHGGFPRTSSYGLHMSTFHNQHDFPEKAGSSRPALASHSSATSALLLSRHTKPGRRRKHRVVNLRRMKMGQEENGIVSGESNVSVPASASESEAGLPLSNSSVPKEQEGEFTTPPGSPDQRPDAHRLPERWKKHEESPYRDIDVSPRQSAMLPDQQKIYGTINLQPSPVNFQHPDSLKEQHRRPARLPIRPTRYLASFQFPSDLPARPGTSPGAKALRSSPHINSEPTLDPSFLHVESSSGGILEQAWMMQMAGMIARRVQEEKSAAGVCFGNNVPSQREDTPPPAYGTYPI